MTLPIKMIMPIDAWVAIRRDDVGGTSIEFVDPTSFSMVGEDNVKAILAVLDTQRPKEYVDHYPVVRIAHVKITEVEASE